MKPDKPRISIGLPVYNGERFLREALDSLLSQTYFDFELIISDNASTDETESICRAYAAKDRRVRYYRNKENLGCAYNYRRAFELSTAKYFKWAAADDMCEPQYLADCVEALDRDPTIVLAHTKAKFIDESGNILDITDPGWDLRSGDPAERLRHVIHAGHWVNIIFGLIRSDALARTRFVGSYPGGDYRLLGELAVLGKFVELPHYLFVRRLHSNASSQNSNNLEWQVTFYTGTSHHHAMPTWSRSLDHLGTILRSPVELRAKMSLVGSLLRQMWWQHNQLFEELKYEVKLTTRRFVPSISSQSHS